MMRLPRRYRPLIMVLALWIAIEPLAVSILRAEEGKPDLNPVVSTKTTEGTVPMEEVMTPVEYLEYLLELRGMTKDEAATPEAAKIECEAKAWADWLQMISNTYMMMGSHEADVHGFYAGIYHSYHKIHGTGEAAHVAAEFDLLPKFGKAIARAANKTAMLFAYMGTGNIPTKGKNMLNAFARMSTKTAHTLSKTRTFQFLEFMAVPTTHLAKGSKTLSETQQYIRWVKKITGHAGANSHKMTISNFKGVARSIGIGLVVLALVMDTVHLATSSDVHGGRISSWDTVSTGIYVLLSSAALICMFVPGGQIVALCTLAWFAIVQIMNAVGSHNKKWKEAYKNSYWFLYEKDPAFKSFYDNRSSLKPDEKCASLVLAEKNFGDVLKQQTPQNEDEKAIHDNGKGVFEALEKQGVLMTYYSQTDFGLPDFDINRLQELWRKKADFMSWKPNEQEAKAEKERGFFGDVLHAVNPMTYVTAAGNAINSSGLEKEVKNSDIKLVYFNPDFVLIKKYKGYLMGKNLKGGLYDVLNVRIEQSPFNYIPLVGIDSAFWTDELLDEAFQADSFVVGTKEMNCFTKQVEIANEEVDKSMKSSSKQLKGLQKDFIPNIRKSRELLEKLMVAYRDAPDNEIDLVFNDLNKAFGWQWNNKWGLKTPKTIVANYRADIEQKIQFLPLGIGQMAAETVALGIFAKQIRDTSALLDSLLKEKKDLLANFESEFKNDAIKKYLKEGTFLDIKGSSGMLGMDWFSGLYPAYEELRKSTQLFENVVKSYREKAEKAGATHDEGWLFWKTQIKDPDTVLSELNAELDGFQKITEIYESMNDSDAQIAVSSTDPNVYPENGFNLVTDPTTALNPNVANQPAPESTYINPLLPAMTSQ
ncbi:MAG: hypothetical protein HQM10_08365 [Candidatus Riflebacteria bacterium]|nr:hypothetical protein [Candidatus Riflebacteria bacterium]